MADNKASIILSAEDRTRAAFASVRGSLDSLQSTAAGLTVRFAAIGAAISAGLAALRLSSITDTLDQLDDLSEKSGIAVERLSELRFAGESVGTPLEDIATSTRKLAQNMAAAAGGSKEAAAAFAAIRVEVKNTDGTLRSTDEVLLDVADRFSNYRDGAAKAALAQEIFGKSGERLIPLLNQGRDGIARLTTEARALGAVYGGDLAKRAADLNDNIAKLKLASEAAAVNGLGPLIKRLADFSFEILEARKNGTLLEQMLAGLQDFLSGRSNRRILLGRDELFAPDNEVQAAEDNVKRVRSAIAKLQDDLARNPSNNRAAENLQRFVGDLADAEAKLQTVRTAAQRRTLPDTGAGGGRGFVAPSAPLKDAPVIRKDAASGDPDKELRRALAERAKALGDALSGEREALSFHERRLAQLYDEQLLSFDEFYDKRGRLQDLALQRQLAAFDAERRALEEAKPKAKTPELRADIDNRLKNDLLRDRTKLEQQAAQAGVLAAGEVTKARQALIDQLDDYKVQLLELRGQEEEADRARAQRQVQQVRALGTRLGEGPEFGNQFEAASAAAVDLAQRRRELAEITEKARATEELYVAQAVAAGRGQREVEQGVYDLRARSLEQLRELIAKVEALAAAGDNPAAARFAEELRKQLTLANAELDPTTKRLFQAAEDIGGAFASSFERAIVEGARLSDVFKAIERDILNIVTRMLVTEPLAASIAQTIKAITTGGGGGGGIEGFVSSIVGSIFGGPRAAGGPVRSGGLYQVNERGPELLQMGSRAFLMMGDQAGRVEPARAGSAAPRQIAISVTVPMPPGASRETALQFGRRVGAEARLALSRNG